MRMIKCLISTLLILVTTNLIAQSSVGVWVPTEGFLRVMHFGCTRFYTCTPSAESKGQPSFIAQGKYIQVTSPEWVAGVCFGGTDIDSCQGCVTNPPSTPCVTTVVDVPQPPSPPPTPTPEPTPSSPTPTPTPVPVGTGGYVPNTLIPTPTPTGTVPEIPVNQPGNTVIPGTINVPSLMPSCYFTWLPFVCLDPNNPDGSFTQPLGGIPQPSPPTPPIPGFEVPTSEPTCIVGPAQPGTSSSTNPPTQNTSGTVKSVPQFNLKTMNTNPAPSMTGAKAKVIVCPRDQILRNGHCVTKTATSIVCPRDQLLKNGHCVNKASSVMVTQPVCPRGQVSKNGHCVTLPIVHISCPKGEFYSHGHCVPIKVRVKPRIHVYRQYHPPVIHKRTYLPGVIYHPPIHTNAPSGGGSCRVVH